MRNLLFILTFIFSINLQAQDDNATNPVGSLRFDILAPGVGGEIQLKETQTIAGAINFGFAFGASFSSNGGGQQEENYFIIAPTIHAQYRYFFNRPKRIRKGKSVYNNSGLFLGAHIRYNAPDIYSSDNFYSANDGLNIGPIFGVQKTWDNNLQLGISIGLGYNSASSNESQVDAIGSFNFSYVILPKRKNRE